MFRDEASTRAEEVVIDRCDPRGGGELLPDGLHGRDEGLRRRIPGRDHQDQAVHHPEIVEETAERLDRRVPLRKNVQQVRPDRDARYDHAGSNGGEQEDDGDLSRSRVDHAGQA